MEFRFFQIVVPLFCLLLILRQLFDYRNAKANIFETILVTIFWGGIAVFAMYPDFFSRRIAKFFEIKNHIDAIIFFALGLLFYFQFQLYKIFKKQDQYLTELTRKIALKNTDSDERE